MSTIFLIFLILLLCYTQRAIVYYVKASKEKDLVSLMNRKVEIADLWIKANKLTINATKSNALVATPGAKTVTKKNKQKS